MRRSTSVESPTEEDTPLRHLSDRTALGGALTGGSFAPPWLLVTLAATATLVTLALLVWSLLAEHRRQRRLDGRVRRDRRHRHGMRDPREALTLVGNALAATHNPHALMPVILQATTEATGAAGGRLLDHGQEVAWVGEPGGQARTLEFQLGSEEDEDLILVLYPPEGGFSDEAAKLAEWLAAQAAIALENARLHHVVQRQAITDELTRLVNRRRFMEALRAEIETAEGLGSTLSLLLADLDDFKHVNDAYGHQAGDEVLHAFAETLQAQLRDVDIAGRLGGEEFAVLLPDADVGGAAAVARRLRIALARSPVGLSDGRRVETRASFGVAEHVRGEPADELLRRADTALYDAKARGKDRTSIGR